jgi:hypothetical protein
MATNPPNPPDWTTIVTAIAAAIQAFSAIVVTVLTVFLVRFTRSSVKATQGQLEEMKTTRAAGAKDTARQLQEIERGRTTSLRPYVHVEKIGVADSRLSGGSLVQHVGNEYLVGLQLVGRVVNVGPGAAFDIRTYVGHDHLNFNLSTAVQVSILKPGESREEFNLPRGDRSDPVQPGMQWPPEVRLRLEYRDLFDRWWKTTVKLFLGAQIGGNGQINFQNITLVSFWCEMAGSEKEAA